MYSRRRFRITCTFSFNLVAVLAGVDDSLCAHDKYSSSSGAICTVRYIKDLFCCLPVDEFLFQGCTVRLALKYQISNIRAQVEGLAGRQVEVGARSIKYYGIVIVSESGGVLRIEISRSVRSKLKPDGYLAVSRVGRE